MRRPQGTSPDLARMDVMARRIRSQVIEMSHRARTPHLGSSLSCVDILVTLYSGILNVDPAHPRDPARDRFILSKGHAATTLYAVLADRGFFSSDLISTYAEPGSALAEHPSPGCAPGVEAATGSLGHGLSLGAGMALSAKILGREYRAFVLLSDGECNEGTVWEAAMFSPKHGLDRLIAIVDFNKWQATGRSRDIMAIEPLREKWEAFGWSAREVDGHDLNALWNVLHRAPDGSGKPMAVIAHTVKGRGVSFMEDDNNWHYRIPDVGEVRAAKQELGTICP